MPPDTMKDFEEEWFEIAKEEDRAKENVKPVASSLIKRFEERFERDTDPNDKVSGWLRRVNDDGSVSIARVEDITDWLTKELQALVGAVGKNKMENTKEESTSDWFYGYGFNAGLETAAHIIKQALLE